jgi:hypothetical protein
VRPARRTPDRRRSEVADGYPAMATHYRLLERDDQARFGGISVPTETGIA